MLKINYISRKIGAGFRRRPIAILCVIAIAGCAAYAPRDENPETRAQFDQDMIHCRAQAGGNNYGVAGALAGIIAGALYGVIHGAAAGAGAGSVGEGALVGAAGGAGIGFIIGLGGSVIKYNETLDRCMEARGHRAR